MRSPSRPARREAAAESPPGSAVAEPEALRLRLSYRDGAIYREAVRSVVLASAPPSPGGGGLALLPKSSQYGQLMRTALAHFNAGNHEQARELFALVYRKQPNARLAWALGRTEFDLRNLEAARGYLQQALDSPVLLARVEE